MTERGGPRVSALLLAAIAFAALVAAAVQAGADWPVLALAFGSGFLAAGALSLWWLVAPLCEVVAACRAIEEGNLETSAPERGSPELRTLARLVNGLAADLQEILLLFAHMLRSLQHAWSVLGTGGAGLSDDEREVLGAARDETARMQEVITDFKYYRVALRGGVFVDTGVPAPATHGGVDHAALGERT